MFKSIKLMLLGLLVAISFSGCFTPSTVDAGEEGVLIKKPWFLGHGGVEPERGSRGGQRGRAEVTRQEWTPAHEKPPRRVLLGIA